MTSSSDENRYIRPLGLIFGADAQALCAAGQAVALAGGPLAFTHAEVTTRAATAAPQRIVRPVTQLGDWLHALSAPRASFGGLELPGHGGRPLIMGIVNVTPDSFSDGGDYADRDQAVAHGRALFAAGADIVDVGGESTRPGAAPVPLDDELARVLPVVAALAGDGIPVSVDTRNAPVMQAAIDAGARVVNDVSALRHDAAALDLVAAHDVGVILMHMQGAPATMQKAPRYDDVVLNVYDMLAERVAACEAAGIARSRICVDPGIGFGKTVAHNLQLIAALSVLHGLGCALAIGVSRKKFVEAVAGPAAPKQRLPGSLAAMLAALDQGAQIVRVHDVAETVQAVALWHRLRSSPSSDAT